jgi:PAS domain S-box-containing protein
VTVSLTPVAPAQRLEARRPRPRRPPPALLQCRQPPIASFAAPITRHLPCARQRVPAFTADGKRWTPIPLYIIRDSGHQVTSTAKTHLRLDLRRLSRATRHKLQITSIAHRRLLVQQRYAMDPTMAKPAHTRGPSPRLVDVTVVATDLAGVITHWNRGAQRTLGWEPGDAIGRLVTELTAAAGRLGTMADVLDEIRRAGQWEGDLEVSRRDGTTFPGYVRAALFHDLDGAPAGIVGVCVDVSAQIETERRLRAAGDYQRAITDNMGEGLYTLDVEGRLMYLNRAGEELLGWRSFELEGEVMHDITRGPRPDGTAVRSDEHVFVRRDDTELPGEVSAAPFETADGVRGTVVVFKDITERKERERELERQLERISWIGRLRAALADDRFELHAQPIVDLATGATVQHELLIRLRDEDGTLVAPGQFLPTAERFGLIGEIDQWVAKQGIGYAACGHAVELNLSAQSLGNPDLLNVIRAELRRTGADPELLAFEITETALVQDAAAAEWLITHLRELGCRVALDDFGTGYGGFTYLKRLPITDLKIDIEFVRDLTESNASQEVVRAVVSLARGFGQRTVAEGVENRETMDLLRELGVDCAQGFAIARPAPVAEVLGSACAESPELPEAVSGGAGTAPGTPMAAER